MNIRKLKRGNIRKKTSSPPSPRIRTMLDKASDYVQYDRYDQAEDICREIIRLSPRTSEAYNILGIIYQEKGLLADAVSALQKAVTLNPVNANGFFNLGTVLSSQGQYGQAVEAFRRGLIHAPQSAKARNNLGLALVRLGKLDDAVHSLEKATELEPHYADAWFNLGDTYYSRGDLKKAVSAFQTCTRLIPEHHEAHFNLSIALHDLELLPEAIESLERTVELDPANEAARHMLAALTGDTPDTAPEQFVTKLFNQYSAGFEKDLVDRLEYKIPSRLRELLDNYIAANQRFLRVMDLGCGTGLSGQAFHDITEYLAGIDISARMLEIARGKKIYNDLLLGDICEELLLSPDRFDLFIATDVMVYIGNLTPLFTAVSSKAQPGAYFIFSIESQEDRDFILQSTGRYGHSSAYINRLAKEYDFTVVVHQDAGIRREGDEWIPGEIYILQKK